MIFRCDDVGDKMYFIKTGYVQITNHGGDQVYTTLGPGSYFGDVAIVDFSAPRRTASAFALSDSVLFTLSLDDFKGISKNFHLNNEHLLRTAKEIRLQQVRDNLLKQGRGVQDIDAAIQQIVRGSTTKIEASSLELRYLHRSSSKIDISSNELEALAAEHEVRPSYTLPLHSYFTPLIRLLAAPNSYCRAGVGRSAGARSSGIRWAGVCHR